MSLENDASFVSKATSIANTAQEKGVMLRLLGAIAFRVHCHKYEYLHKQLGRSISDLDFVAYSKQKGQIEKLLVGLGYDKRPPSLVTYYSLREIYQHPSENVVIDVFFDKLQMCHDIDFKNRLEVDSPTIPLAELLLQKLQIVQLTEKDVKDIVVLMREHEVADHDKEAINLPYISKLLANDWGFYYTATTNLKRLGELLNSFDQLSEADKMDVKGKIEKTLQSIEDKPKSMSWKMRARVGPSKKWYREVEVTTV
ncbi:MAG: hypothetical protein OEZ24_01815 [Candidatus Bathyarchaeota archaeon]|nr:hypothetical protein [Candidatus Bathyarchaeota archaeon]